MTSTPVSASEMSQPRSPLAQAYESWPSLWAHLSPADHDVCTLAATRRPSGESISIGAECSCRAAPGPAISDNGLPIRGGRCLSVATGSDCGTVVLQAARACVVECKSVMTGDEHHQQGRGSQEVLLASHWAGMIIEDCGQVYNPDDGREKSEENDPQRHPGRQVEVVGRLSDVSRSRVLAATDEEVQPFPFPAKLSAGCCHDIWSRTISPLVEVEVTLRRGVAVSGNSGS